ncbi:hypothetical protein J1N35_000624, partial [Gossypium stocksii]
MAKKQFGRNKRYDSFEVIQKGKFKNKNDSNEPIKEMKQGIQCHECHGFGHIQVECANTLKKKKGKSLC